MFPGRQQYIDNVQVRPSRSEDAGFIEALYRSTRRDLLLVDGEADFIENLIQMQFRAQTAGYGATFPDAMYFVVEVMGTRIGRVVVDFGSNEVHIVDIAIVPEARGRGYGTQILRLMQQAAAKVRAPLTLTVGRTNTRARQLYLALGFRVEQADAAVERMAWHPPA